ncbi:MAG: helicase C-terminal domain-containing protein [Coriobacteriia bacterium]|nr:helicase C-terminal domain-containing protein [Coriobacteriia bacterium]
MATDALSRFLVPGTDPDISAAYATFAEHARTAVFGFEDELAFIDLETTGFDRFRDEIIEVAVVVMRGIEEVERYTTLVKPKRAIPKETTQLTGIDDAMVVEAPPIESVVTQLVKVVGKRDMVAHNASFDREFLEVAGAGPTRLRGHWLDSLPLSRIALPRLRSHRLTDLVAAFGIDGGSCHRACDDTDALVGVWRVLLTALDAQPDAVLGELARILGAKTPLGGVIAHLSAARKPKGAFDLKQLRQERLRHEKHEAMADAAELDLVCPPAEEVLAEFSAKGVVGQMYPGYEQRGEQAQMAEAVLAAFSGSTHLAVEAGTGVGKSVAYLVPAARFSLANHVAVGVATKTNTLMDQLVYGELPALAEALGGSLRYVALKGYEHYICLRKLQRVLDSDAANDELREALAMLVAWTAQSSWGDADAVNLHWPPGLKRALTASAADCTKKRCRYWPQLCYLHGQRRRAAQAHIVVTNHALLFCDLTADGGILPPIRHWVIDEAHGAEDEARKQLSFGTSHQALAGLLSGMHTKGRGGYLDALRARVALEPDVSATHLAETIDSMRETVELASTLAESFFDFLKDLSAQGEGDYDRVELRVTPQMRETGAWGTAAGVGRSLAKRLEEILRAGRSVVTGLEELGEGFTEQRYDLAGQLSGIAQQLDGLVLVLEGEDGGRVYSVTADRRRDQRTEALSAACLDVGEVLAEELYPKLRSVVYTSATIATGDDFGHFLRAVGLDRVEEEHRRTLRLASSYDFERQMAVFVPSDLPEPGAHGYLDALEKLLFGVHTAMGGSVLTLFTNRRDMTELYRRLVDPLEREGLRLLVQSSSASRKRLRDEFLADEKLSLFATKSFWEGFDAKGDTLRCVVVPRLPFGPVRNPLYEERRDRDGRAWDHYYLPEAVLELKQAAGRLIRSGTDTGCLVLADARLVSGKRYARQFLEALPVSDVETLLSADVIEEIRRRFGER